MSASDVAKKLADRGPDPLGDWARVQRAVRNYAARTGLGDYVHNSALPTGKVKGGRGVFSFYARRPGDARPTLHEVGAVDLFAGYWS